MTSLASQPGGANFAKLPDRKPPDAKGREGAARFSRASQRFL